MSESSLLDDIIKSLEGLSEAQLAQASKEALKGTHGMLWVPNPGPQEEAYNCDADELYFGGSVGGGKTDLLIGLALNKHKKSLIIRRINDDARGLADRMVEVVGHTNGLNRTLLEWRMPDGRSIDFGGCQLEDDKQRYKGRPHDLVCVGRGTPVLMGDGSWTPVEELSPGQFVQTMEGPKRVQRIYPNQRKECVEVTARDENGVILARQIQSTAHSLFSGSNWICSASQAGAYGPNLSHDSGKPSQWYWEKYGSPWKRLSGIDRGSRQTGGPFRLCADHLSDSVLLASCLLSGPGTYSESYNGLSPDMQQPLLSFFRQGPPQPFLRSVSPASYRQSVERGALCGRSSSLFLDWMGRCWSYIRQHGERTLKSLGLSTGPVSDLKCLLLRVGVEQPIPSRSLDSGAAQTQIYTPQLSTYAHPYTKEIRPISLSCSAQYGALDVSYVGEMEVYDLQIEEVRHYITKGGFVNKNCFDEGADLTESQFEFIKIWNRSADPNQKCRVVVASNPPTTAAGLWIARRWAAWIDKRHPNPAKSGEIRWYIRNTDGVEIEVDGAGPHPMGGEMIRATSRTFIRSSLEDNPNYMRSGYKDRLHLLPEDLQKAYRGGDYDVGMRDQPNQLIPAVWIEEAQKRWRPSPPPDYPMTTMGVDCSGGGTDPMIIAQRYDTWFAPLVDIPGKDIPMDAMGKFAMAHIISRRKDLATIVLDMGGGYGQSIFENLKENRIDVVPYKGAEATNARTADRQHGFYNYRSYAWWKMREALDPDQEQGSPIALPPDTALMADLSTPTFQIEARGVKIETKEAINKRLGRSTDRGDAVVMAWIGSISSAYGGNVKHRNGPVSVVTKRTTRNAGIVVKRRR